MGWNVPRMWEGGDVWLIGGGPSVTEQFEVPQKIIQQVLSKELPPSAYSPYMKAIHNKHVIGINAAYLIGDWIDMVFFGDKRWFLENRKRLAEFPGLKVTCHPNLTNNDAEQIKVLPRHKKHGKGISPDSGRVCWNGNSGAAAISVAVNAGASRIILLGFDMKLDENNKQHWHGLYGSANRKKIDTKHLPFSRHLLGFLNIRRDSLIRGVEILNACPDSTIKEFEKTTVKKVLATCKN